MASVSKTCEEEMAYSDLLYRRFSCIISLQFYRQKSRRLHTKRPEKSKDYFDETKNMPLSNQRGMWKAEHLLIQPIRVLWCGERSIKFRSMPFAGLDQERSGAETKGNLWWNNNYLRALHMRFMGKLMLIALKDNPSFRGNRLTTA